MSRVEGIKLSIYKDDEDGYMELVRQYQDPEGWAVTDAGLNEDEQGYYFGVEARGPYGEKRDISVVFTREAIESMLIAVNERFTEPVADTFTRTVTSTWGTAPQSGDWDWDVTIGDLNAMSSCCVDGCTCQNVVSG